MLSAKNLHFSYGPRTLLDSVTFSLLEGERVALVGDNGAGKSTLFSLLEQAREPDSGSVSFPKTLSLGVLKQVPELPLDISIEKAVHLGLAKLFAAIKEHAEVCEKMGEVLPEKELTRLDERLDSLTHSIDRLGGFDIEHKVDRVLYKLGIKELDKKISELSGGERRRVDLARLLVGNDDCLLLDEPTNHLDIEAITFLGTYLSQSQRPILLISHDRAFVDDVATRIVELDNGTLYSHTMPFDTFLTNKATREEVDAQTAHRTKRKMIEELKWLRAGVKARTTKQEARKERAHELIDTVNANQAAHRELPENLLSAKSGRLGKTILEFHNAGYTMAGTNLFEGIHLGLVSGQRIGIVGPNGFGKTTFLNLIDKTLEPTKGEVKWGKNTSFLRFEQNRAALDPEMSLKNALTDGGDQVFIGADRSMHVASYLERYLFDGSDMYRKIATLSGGEQNRLYMAGLMRSSANCWLLDEPTNDLDIITLGLLEKLLVEMKGVAFIVSHDRAFLDHTCNGILEFEPSDGPAKSKVTFYQGNYSTYLRLKAQAESKTKPSAKPKEAKATKAPAKRQKRSYKEQREYEALEGKIAKTEKKKDQIMATIEEGSIFQTDPKKAQALTAELVFVEKEIESLYTRWEELEEKA